MIRAKPTVGWACGLAPSTWSDLDTRGRLRRLSRGSTLFVQGEGAGAVTVLLEGRLKVVHVADDGTVLLVEPYANDRTEDNFNPVGRMFYAASIFLCTPNSLSQPVGRALGAQAGEARMRDVMTEAGFTRFRRATETPVNIVYEARR